MNKRHSGDDDEVIAALLNRMVHFVSLQLSIQQNLGLLEELEAFQTEAWADSDHPLSTDKCLPPPSFKTATTITASGSGDGESAAETKPHEALPHASAVSDDLYQSNLSLGASSELYLSPLTQLAYHAGGGGADPSGNAVGRITLSNSAADQMLRRKIEDIAYLENETVRWERHRAAKRQDGPYVEIRVQRERDPAAPSPIQAEAAAAAYRGSLGPTPVLDHVVGGSFGQAARASPQKPLDSAKQALARRMVAQEKRQVKRY